MIDPTAIVSPESSVHGTASVGAYAIIEGKVSIGANCRIAPHAQIIGDTVIGKNCVIGRGAIIGEMPQDLTFDEGICSGVRIGKNNRIRELVTIHRGAKEGGMTVIGDNNFLMAGSHFAHDVVLGDHNIVANNCLLAGHVRVGNRTFLGGGSVFHQFIRIGDYALSQGNSAVSKDIPPYCVVSQLNGLVGLNVIGLRRAGMGAEERNAIKRAYDRVFRGRMYLTKALEDAELEAWPECAARFLEFLRGKSLKGVCFPG